MIHFGPDVCHDLDQALEKEWLETNGLGGYASSTIVGVNTRRYHGLLIAALNPPVDRVLLLAKLEETVVVGEQPYQLSANLYPGAVNPTGHLFLAEFLLAPMPTFRYEFGDCKLEKRIFMVHGENTTVVQYTLLEAPGPVSFELQPLIACRDHHGTMRYTPEFDFRGQVTEGQVTFRPYPNGPRLHLRHPGGKFTAAPYWYYNFEHPVEAYRGLEAHEDLANPGVIQWTLKPGESASVIASTDSQSRVEPAQTANSELRRRIELGWDPDPVTPFTGPLHLAADAFLVKREPDELTVIAGYPWFTDWGRDTMISLPGLTLVTGRFDEARRILAAFAQYCSQGMIPNRFPDSGEPPEYNTMDASLWFVQSARRYVEYTGDIKFLREKLMPTMVDIIRWHIEGTRFGIHMTDDFLLTGGKEACQLTWMDAKVGDWVVTPRIGKPVEINALWYAALRTMVDLSAALKADAEQYRELAEGIRRNFSSTFWNDSAEYLYDCITDDGPDSTLRPNQIFAVSLADDLLSAHQAQQVVRVVQEQLLTPYGLRSLSPLDSRYVPVYGGDQAARDGAYHQGTVWPWLLGPFITAFVRVNGGTGQAREQARSFLERLPAHLSDAGLGSISEIFDGDTPHHPRGCIAQAWSVAEILRAYHEDILGHKPRFPLSA